MQTNNKITNNKNVVIQKGNSITTSIDSNTATATATATEKTTAKTTAMTLSTAATEIKIRPHYTGTLLALIKQRK